MAEARLQRFATPRTSAVFPAKSCDMKFHCNGGLAQGDGMGCEVAGRRYAIVGCGVRGHVSDLEWKTKAAGRMGCARKDDGRNGWWAGWGWRRLRRPGRIVPLGFGILVLQFC